MLERLLLGGLLATAAILVVSAVIVALAPYIAIGLVLWIGYKLLRKQRSSGPGNLPTVTNKTSRF
jgi:hypothetical protein